MIIFLIISVAVVVGFWCGYIYARVRNNVDQIHEINMKIIEKNYYSELKKILEEAKEGLDAIAK